MHLFSKSDMFFFVASESSKEIPDRNYLQIYQGSQPLSRSWGPWLSLYN